MDSTLDLQKAIAINSLLHDAYDAEGRVVATWGATYPVAYEYDTFGRMAAMYTYRGTEEIETQSQIENLKSQMDRTRWLYHEPTGLPTNKLYADSKGTAYTYTPDGKLATRTWARLSPGTGDRLVTLYAHDPSGSLTNIVYSDDTPAVTFAYDRLGRQKVAQTFLSAHHFAYDGLDLVSETVIDPQTGASPPRNSRCCNGAPWRRAPRG